MGTTNKTRVGDYEQAITADTALLLRVHPSNYRIRGFTARPGLDEMVALARRRGVPLVEDIGSGCLVDLKAYGIEEEPLAHASLEAGVDVVCFSADKLLGGPQAGIIAGARRWVEPIRKNPLMRTYRVDKLVYGALEATLASYRTGRALEDIPVLHMIAETVDRLRDRARRFARRVAPRLPPGTEIVQLVGQSVVGGGSCPATELDTALLAFRSPALGASAVESRLRTQDPAIVVRVEDDRVVVDLRTVFPAQESLLAEGLARAFYTVENVSRRLS